MRSDQASQQPTSSIRHIAIGAAISCCVIFAMACGNADSQDAMSPDGYEIVGRATSVPATATAAPVAEEVHKPVIERQINVMSAEGDYADSDFKALANFKLNKSYDVEGLESAKIVRFMDSSVLIRTNVKSTKPASILTTKPPSPSESISPTRLRDRMQ